MENQKVITRSEAEALLGKSLSFFSTAVENGCDFYAVTNQFGTGIYQYSNKSGKVIGCVEMSYTNYKEMKEWESQLSVEPADLMNLEGLITEGALIDFNSKRQSDEA